MEPFDLQRTTDGPAPSDAAWALSAGCVLRPRNPADWDFLAALYAETRDEELRPVHWTRTQKLDFLRDQFGKQHAHYLAHYPAAEWWVIVRNEEPVGRIYLEQTQAELRLMDIALTGAHRGRGLGSRLIDAVLRRADEAGVPVRLHVEPFNPALRLYTRRGFRHRETRGVYWFMERPVGAASVEDQLVAQPVSAAADGHHEQVQSAQPGM